MNTGEPPRRTLTELPELTPPVTQKLTRLAFAATVPDLANLQRQLSIAVHDALWTRQEKDGPRMTLATHSTLVHRNKEVGTVNLVVTVTPREGNEVQVRETIQTLLQQWTRSLNGTMHGIFENEEELGELVRGKIPTRPVSDKKTNGTEQLE